VSWLSCLLAEVDCTDSYWWIFTKDSDILEPTTETGYAHYTSYTSVRIRRTIMEASLWLPSTRNNHGVPRTGNAGQSTRNNQSRSGVGRETTNRLACSGWHESCIWFISLVDGTRSRRRFDWVRVRRRRRTTCEQNTRTRIERDGTCYTAHALSLKYYLIIGFELTILQANDSCHLQMTRCKHLLSSILFVNWWAVRRPRALILISNFLDVSPGAKLSTLKLFDISGPVHVR